MEWVETTGRTLEEAKEAALDQLGVDEVDAEFEIMEQPRAGLFGRIRGEARVRARVRPTVPRPKEDRRDRRRRGKAGGDAARSDTTGGVALAETGDAETGDDEGEGGGGTDATPQTPGRGRNSGRSGSAPARANGEIGSSVAAAGASSAVGSSGSPPGTSDDSQSAESGTANRRRRRRGGRSSAAKRAGAGSASSGSVGSGPTESRPAQSGRPAAATETGSAVAKELGPAGKDRETSGESVAATSAETPEGRVKQGHSINGRGDTTVEVSLEEQGRVAEDFLRGLLSEFGVEASVRVSTSSDEEVRLDLTGSELGLLIGPKGSTLLALQDLTRTVVHHQTGATNGRVLVDVGAYRQKRSEALARFAQEVAAKVKETGSPTALEPMAAPDRKVVHDALTDIEGVSTFSEGEEPRRRVVIAPASASSS